MKLGSLLMFGLSGMAFGIWAQAPVRVPEGVKAHRDLVYVKDGHERHKLDLYLPETKSDELLPLIIWVHGGGWQNGSKEGCPPLRGGYVEKGYAVASINYRLSGHAVFPAQIEDCKAAVRWLRAHADEYGLDAKRFGVWGSSAGGHLVALMGTSGDVKAFDVGAHLDQSSRVQAVCDYFGPTDFEVFVKTPGYERVANVESPEAKLLGGAVLENKDKAARANPINYVSKDDPPFLMVHGDADKTVPLNQSELLFESLKNSGVSAQLHTIRGGGHGRPGFGSEEIAKLVVDFFDERLKKGATKVVALTTESVAEEGEAPPMNRGEGRRIPWEMVLRRDDKDGDGTVKKGEFSGPAGLFQRLDANGDGVLTREEVER
ncbi:alpha/beta hydrolase [Phragmitibacter flavus]|nr:alpha/beta hydrolase [Phragmitibacter flavus]